MPIFLISYEQKEGQDCQRFYDAMERSGGAMLADRAWGIELGDELEVVRTWVQGLLDDAGAEVSQFD